jgi:acylglycerol lipase
VTAPLDFLTAADGARLPYRFFGAAPSNRRGSVVYLHGIQSHGGWYVDTAAELARRGFSVYLPDRRGSGASTSPRGHFSRPAQLVDDVRRFLEVARRRHPDRPTFLVGGCWGARPAVATALQEQEQLAGLALVCPAIKVKVDLRPVHKLEVLAGQLIRPRWPVPVPLTPEMFTANPTWLQFVRTDPLSLRHVTARFFFQTALWDRRLARERGLTLPILLLQSGRDPIVDADGVRRWFDRLAAADKESIMYPDFGHILDFEDERQRYWDDLAGWLQRTAAQKRAGSRDPQCSIVP